MSSLLSAEELNDFIRPAVACIKPVEVTENAAHLELEFEDGSGAEPGTVTNKGKKLSQAQISLTDCLACSGCITSSEEVLIAQHSYTEFVEFHKENKGRVYVLSVSHQVRASLANAFDVKLATMDMVLGNIFKEKFGFAYVVSVGVGRDLLHTELFEEVEGREEGKPVLCGSCPGWMLYSTKTQPELNGLLSKVKSPMSITGGLLKESIGEEMYHLSVMPCFDKKLEGSGEDNVDMVITPREVVSMFADYEVDIDAEIARVEKDCLDYSEWVDSVSPDNKWAEGLSLRGWGRPEGSQVDSSGGVAWMYIQEYARRKGGEGCHVETIVGRNRDVTELRAVVDGRVVKRAGIINGFKNIQNLVRKLKSNSEMNGKTDTIKPTTRRVVRRRGEAKNDANGSSNAATNGVTGGPVDLTQCAVIEVNACPSGCINGGGLIAAPEEFTDGAPKWTEQVLSVYNTLPTETGHHETGTDIDKHTLLHRDIDTAATTAAVAAAATDPSALLVSTW